MAEESETWRAEENSSEDQTKIICIREKVSGMEHNTLEHRIFMIFHQDVIFLMAPSRDFTQKGTDVMHAWSYVTSSAE